MPTNSQRPLENIIKGPPLSPWHVSEEREFSISLLTGKNVSAYTFATTGTTSAQLHIAIGNHCSASGCTSRNGSQCNLLERIRWRLTCRRQNAPTDGNNGCFGWRIVTILSRRQTNVGSGMILHIDRRGKTNHCDIIDQCRCIVVSRKVDVGCESLLMYLGQIFRADIDP